MKTIIAATDYTDTGNNALCYAASLASDFNAKLVLYHSYKLPVHASNALLTPSGYDAFFIANRIRLEKLARATKEKYGIPVEWSTNTTELTEELHELALKVQADLVVIGMHETEWTDKLSGNTATSIIKGANFPVLLIPKCSTYNGIDKILFAYDMNSANNGKFSLLKEMAASLHAQVKVYHVETSKEPNKIKTCYKSNPLLETALKEVEHSYTDVWEDDVIVGIDKGVQEFKADLLVMVPHKEKFWNKLAYRSSTRKMALRTQVPLLTMPDLN